jgi:hypothetical protein
MVGLYRMVGDIMYENDEFRCDGCEHRLNPVDCKLEGLKVRYILTDFQNHKTEHYCSKECMK